MGALYREADEKYFAASNTNSGFKSYFDEIFDKEYIERIYILKGGPGVGKSTFLRKTAKRAKELGFTPVFFYCSSDPDSLDGVIVKEKEFAVIDGTSPHVFEPRLAGAREIIINLGEAWDTEGLFKKKTEIEQHSKNKTCAYKDCYKLLGAKCDIDVCIQNLFSPYILNEKIQKSTSRLICSLFKSKSPSTSKTKVETRLATAFSCKGKVRFDTFEKMADYCIFLKDLSCYDVIAYAYLKELYKCAKNIGGNVFVSRSAQNPDLIDGLYFADIKVSVTLFDDELVRACDLSQKRCKIINCKRFCNEKNCASLRPLARFYKKLSSSLEEKALECLKKAGDEHFKLEKIYGDFTDYKKVEKITDNAIKNMF